MPKVSDDSPLSDRINYILHTEINPGLASHGGEVSLVGVVDDGIAVPSLAVAVRAVQRSILPSRKGLRRP